MKELTDLEICKRIAEIEGELVTTVYEFDEALRTQLKYGSEFGYRMPEYNPLTDDALCFRLMVKYKVDFIPYHPDEYRAQIKSVYVVNKGPNEAICLAIIEASQ